MTAEMGVGDFGHHGGAFVASLQFDIDTPGPDDVVLVYRIFLSCKDERWGIDPLCFGLMGHTSLRGV